MSGARAGALGAIAIAAIGVAASAQQRQPLPTWPDAVVEGFESLPVQDGGRVKPLATVARYSALRVTGRASVTTTEGRSVSASEWLLDALVFPERTLDVPLVLVDDASVLGPVAGERTDRSKRGRWSWHELEVALPELRTRARAARMIPAQQRTPFESQGVRVVERALEHQRWTRAFDFARGRIAVVPGTRLARVCDGRPELGFADVVASAPAIVALERALAASEEGRETQAVRVLWQSAELLARDSAALAWIPPLEPVELAPEWLTPADLLARARRGEAVAAQHVQLLRTAAELVAQRTDPVAFGLGLDRLNASVADLAGPRGELARIDLELAYQRLGLLHWSLALHALGFVIAAFACLAPRARALAAAAMGTTGLAALALVAAIVLRCLIRGRPPVSTLYETVLFVTAAGSLLSLFLERIQRLRIANAVGALLGMVGLLLAGGYERLDGEDTMPSLVAVLDTNFWLATHVTAITLGYAAGLLAALLASAYILTACLRGAHADPGRQRALARSVYGVTCFALCFSVVGTILGGIWANESWGRFWGWDPKENGALLICISQLALLHARRAGIVRDLGTCMAAAFGGTVVAFSWWGVNLLGVGLHSYGFTSGVQTALWTYYAIQWSVVGLGVVAWSLDRARRRPGALVATVVLGQDRARKDLLRALRIV